MSLYPGDSPDNPNGHLDPPTGAFGQPVTAPKTLTGKDWFLLAVVLLGTVGLFIVAAKKVK